MEHLLNKEVLGGDTKMKETYTLGQIIRLGLLKNHMGKPYKHKATILPIILRLPHTKIKTIWGVGYAVSKEEIDKFNTRWGK